jgi:DNA gyrase subunit A
MEGGKVVRSAVTGVPAKGRDTMGVIFAKPDKGDRIIAVARNSERALGEEPGEEAADGQAGEASAEAPAEESSRQSGDAPEQADAVTLAGDQDQNPGGNE